MILCDYIPFFSPSLGAQWIALNCGCSLPGCTRSDRLCQSEGHVQAVLWHCYTVEAQQDWSGEIKVTLCNWRDKQWQRIKPDLLRCWFVSSLFCLTMCCCVLVSPPGGVVGHLGVNAAPQPGSGSCSIHHVCSAYCDFQDSNVRLSSTSDHGPVFLSAVHSIFIWLPNLLAKIKHCTRSSVLLFNS